MKESWQYACNYHVRVGVFCKFRMTDDEVLRVRSMIFSPYRTDSSRVFVRIKGQRYQIYRAGIDVGKPAKEFWFLFDEEMFPASKKNVDQVRAELTKRMRAGYRLRKLNPSVPPSTFNLEDELKE